MAKWEVIPQEKWPITKSLTKRCEPKAPPAIHGPLFYQTYKTNAISGCLENQFTAHNLCDCDYSQQVGATIQALLKARLLNSDHWRLERNTLLEIR
jgi:hypothetical protein